MRSRRSWCSSAAPSTSPSSIPKRCSISLDYEAEFILDYVSNDIAFQPYEGVLRGVAGTLRARAGNSLDQSILLASVLKSAGYDARVL